MSKELLKLRRSALMGSAATLLASFALGAGVTGVSAQDADTDDSVLEEVVVTGSRIVRKDFTSVSPISVTSSEDVKISGFTRVEEMMNSLPQVEAAQTGFISNGATGTANLDLRGLGTNRTLVLMNGRRLPPGGSNGDSMAPDINQIPAALVERIETITGGASTTYGADAVAGVVNFIMKDDFEGVEITAGISGYQHNNRNDYIQGLMDDRGFAYPSGNTGIDGKQYNIDMAMGGEFADGKGHATMYATWRKVEELRQEARDYSSCALNNAGTRCGGSANAIVPNFYLSTVTPDGEYDWDNDTGGFWTLDATEGFKDWGGNVYNYAPVNHFQRPDERWILGGFATYQVNDNVEAYLETSFMRDRTKAQIAESGTFFAETYVIDYDSGLLNDAQRAWLTNEYGIGSGDQFATYIGKRNVEGGPRSNLIGHDSFRIVTGARGNISDNWRYDASFLYASTTFTSAYINDFYAPNISAALANEAYHVFTIGGVTAEEADALTGTAVREGLTAEYVANAYVTGDLGFTVPSASDAVQAVIGVEYRKETYEATSDTVYAEGLLLGQGGETPSIAGSYDVKEIFGELSIPLVQDAEFAKEITLGLAGRYSDYSTSGSNETYKVELSWSPADILTMNASYNRAVRAPNVGELFSTQTQGLWSGSDPCSGTTPAYTQAQCANTGVTAAQYGTISASPASQYNGIYGGNPDLSPETADTWSVGAVIRPVDGLVLRVDYWDIKVEDVIGNIPAADALEQCANTGNEMFCSLINRAPNGSLWLGTAGNVSLTPQNLGKRHWQGIDVLADYGIDALNGTFTAKLNGTYMMKKEYTSIVGVSDPYDCAGTVSTSCFPQPDWRHSLTVSYDSSSFWSVTAKWRYFSKVDYNDTADSLLVADGGIKAQSYFDLKAAFDVNEHVGLLIGVNNIFDKEPPMVGGTLSGYGNANAIAGYYDTLGRYVHASMTVAF